MINSLIFYSNKHILYWYLKEKIYVDNLSGSKRVKTPTSVHVICGDFLPPVGVRVKIHVRKLCKYAESLTSQQYILMDNLTFCYLYAEFANHSCTCIENASKHLHVRYNLIARGLACSMRLPFCVCELS